MKNYEYFNKLSGENKTAEEQAKEMARFNKQEELYKHYLKWLNEEKQ